MKRLKLWIHNKEFDENELVLNPREFPDLKIGDVFEVYHPEIDKEVPPGQPRVLLQVSTLREDFAQKEVVSVEQTVANAFNLRNYKDVFINRVDAREVVLDLVEISFKEQYISRADMWNLKKILVGGCVYLQKKIDFFNARMQVREMWSRGERVACGAISENTRIVFRSSTASISIFIQMSVEMWEFDSNGDLYFEKSVTGFLTELFSRWKDDHCNHDVTIVLFSRVFYEAESLNDFPADMRHCILQNTSGIFYEDYYLVPVQNERYEDWSPALVVLKKLFHSWKDKIYRHHRDSFSNFSVPIAHLSNAAQGNYLEVLNISLNLYDKSYIDRIFDHTGQVTIVLTAGSGVFEVERDLAHLTKQRTIDNGIGSDLVCMGEQPLHVVPLFKYIDTDESVEFYVPHWINLSFYRMDHGFLSSFNPRIRVPELKMFSGCCESLKTSTQKIDVFGHAGPDIPNGGFDIEFEDFDSYDASVFAVAKQKINVHGAALCSSADRIKVLADDSSWNASWDHPVVGSFPCAPRKRDESNPPKVTPASQSSFVGSLESDGSVDILLSAVLGATTIKDRHQLTTRINQAFDPIKNFQDKIKQHPLNPFAPSLVHFKMSSNRRRWVHAFPPSEGNVGIAPRSSHSSECEIDINLDTIKGHTEPMEIRCSSTSRLKRVGSNASFVDVASEEPKSPSSVESGESMLTAIRAPFSKSAEKTPSRSNSFNSMPSMLSKHLRYQTISARESLNFGRRCGRAGICIEDEWNTTFAGVDWKALTIPAILPTTTDFAPKKEDFEKDYYINEYSVYPYDYWESRGASKSQFLTVHRVFETLISQRLAKGFQIVSPHRSFHRTSRLSPVSSVVGVSTKSRTPENYEEFLLGIGRIFHRITLCGNVIKVAVYRPRSPQICCSSDYRYQFQVPDASTFGISTAFFAHAKLENVNWNYVDNYVTVAMNPRTRRESEFVLLDSMTYWRSRFLLLPSNNPATRRIVEGETNRCDVYMESMEETSTLVDAFLRFVEVLNRLRRPLRKPNKFIHSLSVGSPRRVSAPLFGLTQVAVRPSRRLSQATPPWFTDDATSLLSPNLLSITEASSPSCSAANSPDERQNSESDFLFPRSSSLKECSAVKTDVSSSALPRLHIHSAASEILDAFCSATDGVSFLPRRQTQGGALDLPDKCFVSAEAVDWACGRIDGVDSIVSAINLFQRFLDESLIFHLSGGLEFVFGTYFYHVGDGKDVNKDLTASFCELLEVALDLSSGGTLEDQRRDERIKVPRFLWPRLRQTGPWAGSDPSSVASLSKHSLRKPSTESEIYSSSRQQRSPKRQWKQQQTSYKNINIDPDINEKSCWAEWARVRCMSRFDPQLPFEIEVQWLVATAPIISELVYSWARKIKNNPGVFHLLPVPDDPFCHPSITLYSDPLRTPLFIPLNVSSLLDSDGSIFADFTAETRLERLQMFQEEILKRFGFLQDRSVPTAMPSPFDVGRSGEGSIPDTFPSWRYVHTTGGFFSAIPVYPVDALEHIYKDEKKSMMEPASTTDEETDTFHQPTSIFSKANSQIGFYWAWNFLLSRRWRTSQTGDRDVFPERFLADFRAFCANIDRRLETFWRSCLDTMVVEEDEDEVRS